jgi:hypothetical protein
MRRRTAGLAALATVTALTAAAPVSAGPPVAAGCGHRWPVLTYRTGGAPVPAAQPAQVCVTSTGYATSEPTLAVTGSGVVIMSPAGTENSSARTTDAGRTWSLTQPDMEQYTSLWNTVDPSMALDRRTGTLFLVHATGPTRTTPVLVDESPLPGAVSTSAAAAAGFQVYRSNDAGRSWRTANYQTAPLGDWEKVFTGPAHTGRGSVVYVCGNSPLEVSGPGRLCYRSLDGGATFNTAGYVFPSVAQPAVCSPLAANNGTVGPDGTVFQPISCSNASYVAVSTDEGASYTWHAVPGAPGAGTSIAGFSFQVAADTGGTLYAMWAQGDHLSVSVSRDHAQNWSVPVDVQAPGQHSIALPQLAAAGPGHVGIGYYAATTPGRTALTAWAVQSTNATDAKAVTAAQSTWTSTALTDPRRPSFTNYGLSGPSPRADYLGATFGPHDRLWIAFVRQLRSPTSDGHIATVGMVGSVALHN